MLNLLYFYINTFRSMCAVPSMAVFCSFLISYFLGMLLRYFLGDFEMIPIASTITGVTFVFKFHTRTVSVVTPLYFSTFWCLSSNCYIYSTYMFFSFFVITDYDVRFIGRNGSVGLHLLIP